MKPVKLPESAQLRLNLEIAFWRHGWRLPAFLVVLGVCAIVWLFWLPIQLATASASADRLQLAQNESKRPAPAAQLEPPLLAFQRHLKPQADTTSQLRLVFQAAETAGVTVSQVDMRRQIDAAGVYSQLQIVLPVRGSYLAIKLFCIELMQEMSALSIDQLILKREQPGDDPVEAQIYLSIWQEPREGVAP